MFKRILIALDGSDTSNLALKHAISLAKEDGSIVKGIHVIDSYHVFPEVELISVEEVLESMRGEGEKVIADAKKKMDQAGISNELSILETRASGERIAEVLVREAKDWPADLIVVGTHGRRGFSHFLLGSVAESIVHIATKPVLLIRSDGK